MKNQASFSSKGQSKKIKMSSAAIFVWRLKGYERQDRKLSSLDTGPDSVGKT